MFFGAAGAVAIAMVFAGCGGAPPPRPLVTPTQTTQEPIFGSQSDAFDAAVVALQRYMDIANQIGAEGGADPARLYETVAEGEWASSEVAMLEDLGRAGRRLGGPAVFSNTRLMQYDDAGGVIQVYACFDVSGARVLDGAGNDVTPPREERVPFLVTFSVLSVNDLKISKAEVWDRPGIC